MNRQDFQLKIFETVQVLQHKLTTAYAEKIYDELSFVHRLLIMDIVNEQRHATVFSKPVRACNSTTINNIYKLINELKERIAYGISPQDHKYLHTVALSFDEQLKTLAVIPRNEFERNNSTEFGCLLAFEWLRRSSDVQFSEVSLFRALMGSIRFLSDKFYIEEYHGNSHQIVFSGNGIFSRSIARCELCDLIIVTYESTPKFKARITFLQLKKHPKPVDVCSQQDDIKTRLIFNANLEQWDLLSRRPRIIGVFPFDPPPHLLKDAILPSVGTFGFFHKNTNNSIGVVYVCADRLVPVGKKQLSIQSETTDRLIHTYPQSDILYSIGMLGKRLFENKIGTPISEENILDTNDAIYRKSIREWLGSILAGHIAIAHGVTPVSSELINHLGLDLHAGVCPQILPNILIIKTGAVKDNAED